MPVATPTPKSVSSAIISVVHFLSATVVCFAAALDITQILQDRGVKISMDGRGRYQDNILVERLWRTVKYEEVYLKAYANGLDARNGLREYFRFYNHRRPHQALGYRTPAEVFHGEPVEEELKERRCPDQPILVSYGGVQESHLIVA